VWKVSDGHKDETQKEEVGVDGTTLSATFGRGAGCRESVVGRDECRGGELRDRAINIHGHH